MKHLILAAALIAAMSVQAQDLETVKVDGKSRTMMVYQPKDLTENRPLVISLHGAYQDAAYQRDQTKWNNCADTANILVVYPNAINQFWDTGGQSDITFISWIIDEMYDRHKIDLNRVYITGFSLGAMMTYHCMEHLGNKVAAFGPVSGVRFDNREPQAPRRVPIIHTHGTGDDVFKWGGDLNHMAGGYPSIPEYVEKWASYEDLTEKEVISPYPSTKTNSNATMTVWRSNDPDDEIEVAMLALKDKGHWHSEDLAGGVSTTQEIWRFCKRYVLQPDAPRVKAMTPEDNAFDLPTSTTSFILTLSTLADVSLIQANLSEGDKQIVLECAETENSNTINFNLPEAEVLAEGTHILTISGIKNPEGGKEKTKTFTYYYGPSEFGDKIKEDFAQLYEYASKVYEQSEGATETEVKHARKRLKTYLAKYADFSSCNPSEYAKATENLMKNIEIIEKYLASNIALSDDVEVIETRYYRIDGTPTDSSNPGVTIAVRHLSDGSISVKKTY